MRKIADNRHSRFFRVDNLARECDVNTDVIYRLIHNGELPAVKIGWLYRIPCEAAEALMRGELAPVGQEQPADEQPVGV